jgi:hypothetical protein
MTRTQNSRERFLLLTDLRRQRLHSRRFKDQTERAIRQLEWELAEGRELAGRAATEREKMLW